MRFPLGLESKVPHHQFSHLFTNFKMTFLSLYVENKGLISRFT